MVAHPVEDRIGSGRVTFLVSLYPLDHLLGFRIVIYKPEICRGLGAMKFLCEFDELIVTDSFLNKDVFVDDVASVGKCAQNLNVRVRLGYILVDWLIYRIIILRNIAC